MAKDDLQLEWDDGKARSNLRKHGVSFERAGRIFRHHVLRYVDEREDYGEVRYVGLGRVETQVYTVVFTAPGENRIRLISAWRASVEDEEFYYREVFPL